MNDCRIIGVVRRHALAAIALAGLTVMLAGCGSGTTGGPRSASSASPSQKEDWGLERIKDAIALLNEGQPEKAREELVKALKVRPGDMLARSLMRQIDTDPKVLLGAENYPYTVKAGETMSDLAQRFLGDPMMSYALARYNGLAAPGEIQSGQTLQIPGKRKVTAPVVIKKPTTPAPEKKPPVVAKPGPVQPKPAQPATNPAQAARLRGQGLAALNGGAVNRAVALFQRALSFDPANALIKRDLARALRIQGTLNSRR